MTGKKVLLIDDEKVLQITFEHALAQSGYVVRVAGNGQDGIDQCAEFEPHIVVIDLCMPVMDGFTAMHRIRRNFPSLPIVVISGAMESVAEAHAERYGASRFLHKPVSIEVLIKNISEFC